MNMDDMQLYLEFFRISQANPNEFYGTDKDCTSTTREQNNENAIDIFNE